jgi:DNA-binding GntR family transcriptional regulator
MSSAAAERSGPAPRRRSRRAGVRAGAGGRRGAVLLREAACEEIKRRIIRLDYRPGQYVNAAQVSADLGIGATPVNQALNRLMHEGMVEIIPRKGAIVRPVSLEEILQLIDVRLVNECHCARLAAERASDGELDDLEGVLDRAEKLVAARDVEGLMLLDREFHMRLGRAARNPVLGELLVGLHERSLRFWFISLSDEEHLAAVQQEHRAVAARLRARDPEGAAAAVRSHIESFRATISKSARGT